MTQPEALRLADELDAYHTRSCHKEAAAELRRLHAENDELWKEREEPHKTIEMYVRECNRLESERDEARRTVREAHEAGTRLTAQRDALLGLLKEARKIIRATSSRNLVKDWDRRTTATIKAVEETK